MVATMPLLRRKELQEIIAHASIGVALCDDRLLEELEGACDRLVRFSEVEEWAAGKPDGFEAYDTAADDVVLIAYTSGTSGRPKGTMHFHRDVLAMCDTFSREIVRPRSDDIFIGSPPIAFTFGLGGIVTFPMRVGAASVLLEQGAPDKLLDAIERHGATACFTAPTAYRRMLALGVRWPDLEPAPLHLRGRDAAAPRVGGLAQGHGHRDHRRHRRDGDDSRLHQRR